MLEQIETGAARRRAGLKPRDRTPVRAGAVLYADATASRPIGAVTSGGFGPSAAAPVAMGYLPASTTAPGRALFAEVRGQRIAIEVVPLPFVPHRYKRKRAGEISAMLKFTQDHEWIRMDGDMATVGITPHAQDQLGDLVFVELPEIGKTLERARPPALWNWSKRPPTSTRRSAAKSWRSTRHSSTSQAWSIPIRRAGWFFKLKIADPAELDGLMDEAAYKALTG